MAETLHHGRQPDIVVRLPGGPVVLEIEIEPAPTVEADALARLGMEIDGRKVQNVFAVTVPGQLRSTAQSRLDERKAAATLEWRIDASSGPWLSGSPVELGHAVTLATPPAGNLDEAVDLLDAGARKAGSRLYSSPGTLAHVSRVFGADPGDESANMAALVIINAMVFQERLAGGEEAYRPVSAARRKGQFSRLTLLWMWEEILAIDYYPIFSMAKNVVEELSDVEAADVLAECAETAAALLGMGAVGRHDLAGRIFNRLISERKLLAAFYTSIPASTLLAAPKPHVVCAPPPPSPLPVGALIRRSVLSQQVPELLLGSSDVLDLLLDLVEGLALRLHALAYEIRRRLGAAAGQANLDQLVQPCQALLVNPHHDHAVSGRAHTLKRVFERVPHILPYRLHRVGAADYCFSDNLVDLSDHVLHVLEQPPALILQVLRRIAPGFLRRVAFGFFSHSVHTPLSVILHYV